MLRINPKSIVSTIRNGKGFNFSKYNKFQRIWKPQYYRGLSTGDRESMNFDVLIVGGGVAGLSASIRLKQLCQKHNKDLEICVIEKGSEIGAHVLSGNVFDPRAMMELCGKDWISEFQSTQDSHVTPVTKDDFLILTKEKSYPIPNSLLPKQLHNDGNYIISLGQICRWLATVAEEMGVEIYPGFAADEVLFDDTTNVVLGVATKDMGIDKNGEHKPTYERGVALLAKQTLFAEGARGSCSEELMSQFDLRSSSHPQTYGLGLKEVWKIPKENHQPGFVQHTLGWPLQSDAFDKTFGGTFLYHQEPDLVLCGLVVGLDYPNPYLNPYEEFQRWKTHPSIQKHFENGECISYGARVLNEGGYHSIPKLTFPGGMLIGCSAGFLNSVKIKGSHTAMKSGMIAAESIFDKLDDLDSKEVTDYQTNMMDSWVQKELYQVRNVHSAFANWGFVPGILYSGLATHIFKGKEPWTLSAPHSSDSESTQPKDKFNPILYPSHDGVLTFDILTNLQRSGTYHDDDQPSHLKIKPEKTDIPENLSMQIYAAPEQRFCPAGVYEYVEDDNNENPNLVINAQNCIHCKCCSIKMPHEYIRWTVPEGGGGPNYQVM